MAEVPLAYLRVRVLDRDSHLLLHDDAQGRHERHGEEVAEPRLFAVHAATPVLFSYEFPPPFIFSWWLRAALDNLRSTPEHSA